MTQPVTTAAAPGALSQHRQRRHLPPPGRFRLREHLRFNMWLVPCGYLLLALAAGIGLPAIDRAVAWEGPWHSTQDSVRTALGAIGSGMIAFTGLVFSLLLLLLQFGSTAFSPRLVRLLRRDRLIKNTMGVFIATFMFSLTVVVAVGQGGVDFPPTLSSVVAFALLVCSLVLFILLVARVMDMLRVARVTRRLAAETRAVLAEAYPDPVPTEPEPAPAPRGELVQTVHHRGIGGTILTLDRDALTRLAAQAGGTVVVTRATGDHIDDGDELIQVYGTAQVPESQLRAAVLVGDERTLEGDPAFGLRVLVDIAIRALSPGINDPTTAVQSLDAISSVLRLAAQRRLAGGAGDHPKAAVPRLIYPTPSWEELLALATTEIRECSQSSSQVRARLRRMLTDLAESAPPSRRPAVLRELELLGPPAPAPPARLYEYEAG